MARFKRVLPASYEVTFLPLVLAYAFFGLGLSLNLYVALIGPMLYGLLCVVFIVADALNGIPMKVLLAKVAFASGCLAPAVVIFWRAMMR